jgi:hypothetical protein
MAISPSYDNTRMRIYMRGNSEGIMNGYVSESMRAVM